MKWVEYIPVLQQPYSSGGGKTSSKEDNPLDKAIYKVLEENGLDTDNDKFFALAKSLLSSQGLDTTEQSVSKLIALRRYANKIKTNKELYDAAREHVKTNNTGDDYAMTSDGKVYILKESATNDGLSLDAVKLDTLKKNQGKYLPITNNQLLELRKKGSINGMNVTTTMAFNETTLHDVVSSIGMTDVMETVSKVIEQFGVMKRSGSELKLGKNVQEGLEGLYKITIEKSNAMVSPEATKAAAQYIYSTLNTNAKNVLKLNAEINGTSVLDYLVYSVTISSDDVYQPEFSKSLSDLNKNSSDDSGLKATQSWANMVMEDGGRPDTFKTIVDKSTLVFNFPGYIYDGITTKDEKSLESVTTASDTFMNLANQGLVDSTKKVYYGNLAVNIGVNGKDILIDNSRGGSVRYLPVDDSGNLSFSMMQQMAEIQNRIVENRITDKAQIKKIWEDAGFLYSAKMNTGVPKGMRLARFWVQDGYTNENTSTFSDPLFGGASPLHGNQFFEKVDRTIMNQYIAEYNSSQEKAGKVGFDIGWFKGMYTESYRGSLFIPLNDDQKQALVLSKRGFIEKPDYDNIKAGQDTHRTISKWQTSASDLD